MRFAEGQRVRVEFDCNYAYDDDGWVVVRTPDGYLQKIWPASFADYATPVAPAKWPPRIGDIWEANGAEYYARENTCSVGTVVLDRFDRDEDDDSEVFYEVNRGELDAFKALNPRLIRRRGE